MSKMEDNDSDQNQERLHSEQSVHDHAEGNETWRSWLWCCGNDPLDRSRRVRERRDTSMTARALLATNNTRAEENLSRSDVSRKVRVVRRAISILDRRIDGKEKSSVRSPTRLRRYREDLVSAVEQTFSRRHFYIFLMCQMRLVCRLNGEDGLSRPILVAVFVMSAGMSLKWMDVVRAPDINASPVQCSITEDLRYSGWEYLMQFDDENSEDTVYVLAARERRLMGSTVFDISLATSSPSTTWLFFDQSIIARLRSKNLFGTRWSLHLLRPGGRQYEMLNLLYTANLLRSSPSTHVARIWNLDEDRLPICLSRNGISNALIDKDSDRETHILRTRQAKYDAAEGVYQLDFRGRVKIASARNFQLEWDDRTPHRPCARDDDENEEDGSGCAQRMCFLFGRVREKDARSNTFAMDFEYPLSPLVAFALSLAQCSEKVAC